MARITIKDIARESGYSIGTVSRTLNHSAGVSDEAREVILKVVAKHNFELNPNAKLLKQRVKNGIAILIRGEGNMLFADLTARIQRQIESLGYDAIIYNLSEKENEVLKARQICTQRNLQGMMFLGSTREHFRRDFSGIKVPSILVTNSAVGLPFSNLSSVSTNDEEAAQFAMETLFSLHHEEIGVLGGYLAESQAAKSRYQGIQFACFDRGKTFDAAKQYEAELFTIEGGYRAMNRLLDKYPQMSAVFAMSDLMAIGAMRAAADRGISVPEDLSIIGFDGLELAGYTIPRLTTIAQNVEEMARNSVQILVRNIQDEDAPVYEEIPFHFLEGESLKDLPSAL